MQCQPSGWLKFPRNSIRRLQTGGTVSVVGLYAEEMRFSPTDAVRNEIGMLFSYSCTYGDYQMALDLLSAGAVDPGPLLTKYPLGRAPEAFEAVGQGHTVKAMLLPQGDQER